MSTFPFPFPGDEYRDGMHDLVMGDVYQAAEALDFKNQVGYFRIACFSNAQPGSPQFDVPLDNECVPPNDDAPPNSGTTDLQLLGRIMAMAVPFTYHGRYYATVRSGAPSAIQYSVDGGASWLWASDLIGKTVVKSS